MNVFSRFGRNSCFLRSIFLDEIQEFCYNRSAIDCEFSIIRRIQMEKKTIGKFISALRRANGMTQKELAEKLFVSDKTVSRWECDECTPDLTLIPVIAELFGVTSDELLRGERKTGDEDEKNEGRYSLKAEKQLKTMLSNRKKQYDNLTMISLGLAIVGLLLSVLCNFAFYNGVLGAVLGIIFYVGSEICQICFARSFRISLEDVEEECRTRAQKSNAQMAKSVVWISVLNFELFAFTLPLMMTGGSSGFQFVAWLGFGSIFSAVALLLVYISYTLWIKPLLIKKEILEENVAIDKRRRRNVARMKKIGAVVVLIGLFIGAAIFALNMLGWNSFANYETYTDAQAFKERMESDYENWYENSVIINSGNEKPGNYYEVLKDYDYVYDNGEKVEYYYRRDLYYSVHWSSGHNMPVYVLTQAAYQDAQNTFQDIQSLLFWLFPADVLGGIFVYLILWGKDKTQMK